MPALIMPSLIMIVESPIRISAGAPAGHSPRASNTARKNCASPSTSGVTIRGVTVPQPSRWNVAMRRPSAADRDPDQMADAIGDAGGSEADQELAQGGERQMAAGEERGAGPDQDQSEAAGG